ncbi:MAG: hypothetical protein OEW75_18185 [Cyclobacteriaceae bacterium]|nr:hypothetical protein [Cyclobacteriaceae bacterium]
MKLNITSVELIFTVNEKDFATFGDEVIHKVYSTFSIARDAEWTGRRLFFVNKEEGEEAVGTHVNVKHRAPAFKGEQVLFKAKAESFEHDHLVCSFVATVNGKIIAEGTTGQKVLKSEIVNKLFNRA